MSKVDKAEVCFKNVITIGDLFLEEVFNVFENENLVFTCVDSKEQRYLCICYEMRQSLEWIVCSIDEDILRRIVEREYDILHAYKMAKKLMQIKYDGEKEHSIIVNYSTIDHNILPRSGIYLDFQCEGR